MLLISSFSSSTAKSLNLVIDNLNWYKTDLSILSSIFWSFVFSSLLSKKERISIQVH